MRRSVMLLLALFMAAPAAGATEDEREREVTPEVVPAVTTDAPAAAELQLAEVQLEERSAVEDGAATQDMPRRGSFLWVVGAIVVAGIILALVL